MKLSKNVNFYFHINKSSKKLIVFGFGGQDATFFIFLLTTYSCKLIFVDRECYCQNAITHRNDKAELHLTVPGPIIISYQLAGAS